MWPSLVVIGLFIFLSNLTSHTGLATTRTWGKQESSLTLYTYAPRFIAIAIMSVPDEQRKKMQAERAAIGIMYQNDSSTNISKVIDHYATVAPIGAAALRNSYIVLIKSLDDYEPTSRAKISEFLEEMAEAIFLRTEYHTAYALFHYLHLRNGLGRSRSLIRELFPMCEKMAQMKEIKEFYLKYRGHEPTSVFILAKFMELLKWLQFQHKL